MRNFYLLIFSFCILCVFYLILDQEDNFFSEDNLFSHKQHEAHAYKNEEQIEREIIENIAYLLTTNNTSPLDVFERHIPIIIVFNNGHVWAFNFTSEDEHWQKKIIHNSQVLYSPINYWNYSITDSRYFSQFDVNSALIYSMDISEKNLQESLLSFLSVLFELSHYNKFSRDSLEKLPADPLNLDNIVYQQVEEGLLADFLQYSKDLHISPFMKIVYLKDFAALVKERKKVIDPETFKWEQQQQKIHGFITYNVIKAFKALPAGVHFNEIEYLIDKLQVSVVNDEVFEQTILWRHNSVGAALCYALDFVNSPNWKDEIWQQQLSQFDLLENALEVTDDEIEPRMAKVNARYSFENIKEHIKVLLSEYNDEVEEILMGWNSLEGISLHLLPCKDSSLCFLGSAMNVFYHHDGMRLSLVENSIYSTLMGSWRLAFLGSPLILKKANGEFVFKISRATNIEIDGQHYSAEGLLKQAREGGFSFNTIILKDEYCEFTAAVHGTLIGVQESLFLQFDSKT